MSRDGEDGGEELPDPSPGWYAIHQPQQDPAKVISGPHNRPEKAAFVASIPSGNSAVMHTPALVNAVKNEGYNVVWQKGAEKPSALEESEPVTDGGRPMTGGSPDEGESVEIDAESAAVAFDALQVLLEFDAHSPPLHPLADIGREPVEEASRTLGEVLAAPGGEDA